MKESRYTEEQIAFALRQAEAEVANLTEALAAGALRASPTLAARFEAAERHPTQLKALEAQPAKPRSPALVPDIASK